MIDIVLILIIIFSFISSFCAVRVWKKTNFVKMVYIEESVSIIFYTIAAFFTGVIFIISFFKLSDVSNSWILFTILLFYDIIMLWVFCHDATKCIYLEKNVLYQKSIFLTKYIKVTSKISITEKLDKVIVEDEKNRISINFRRLSGDTIALVNKVKQLSAYGD
jgi:hypothetical protein